MKTAVQGCYTVLGTFQGKTRNTQKQLSLITLCQDKPVPESLVMNLKGDCADRTV